MIKNLKLVTALSWHNIISTFTIGKKRSAKLVISVLVFTSALAATASVLYGKLICEKFASIGASVATPFALYAVFSIVMFLYNCANVSKLLISTAESNHTRALPIPESLVALSKLVAFYIINLMASLFLLFIPCIISASATSSGILGIAFLILAFIVSPCIPITLAAAVTFFYPRDGVTFQKWLQLIFYIALIVVLSFYVGGLLNAFADNLYHITVKFAMYYFPAAFFGTAVSYGNLLYLLLFIVVSFAALYVCLYTLTRKNNR